MKVKKFQVGGEISAAPAPEAAPAAGGNDPLLEIANMMAQGLQSGDCQLLSEACSAFLSLLSQAQSGAPAEPIGPDQNSQPIFRKGGQLVKRVRKGCKK